MPTFWVTLTGSPRSDRNRLSSDHQALLHRIERAFGARPYFFKVITTEGPQGVIHAFWAFPRGVALWQGQLPHAWLSEAWDALHGAFIVWIKRVGGQGNDARRVARYAVTQYATGGQGTAYVRGDWSRSVGLAFNYGRVRWDLMQRMRDRAWPLPWLCRREMPRCMSELCTRGSTEFAGLRLALWCGELVEVARHADEWAQWLEFELRLREQQRARAEGKGGVEQAQTSTPPGVVVSPGAVMPAASTA